MLNIIVVPSILLLALSAPWLEWGLRHQPHLKPWAAASGLVQLPFNVLVLPAYLTIALRLAGGGVMDTVRLAARTVPAFLCLIMGVNGVIVTSGIAGLRDGSRTAVPFLRTTKYHLQSAAESWGSRRSRPGSVSALTWFDGAWALFGVAALVIDGLLGAWYWLPFHTFVAVGFGLMVTRGAGRS